MALKRVTLVSFAFAGAIAGLGVISYVHPFNAAFLLSHDTQCRLTVADGNLRLVWLGFEFLGPHIDETPFDAYCRECDDLPTHPFRWEQSKQWLSDRTGVDRFEIGCTLFAPLIFLLLVFFIVLPALKHPRRVRFIVEELWYPYNRQGSTAWRWCRRMILASLTCGAMVTALVWTVSYATMSDSIRLAIESRFKRIISESTGATLLLGTGPYAEPLHSVTANWGTIAFASSFRVPTGTVVPTRATKFAGFGWHQGVSLLRPRRMVYAASSATFALRTNQRLTRVTTQKYYLSVWFPLWVLFALCSIWPVLAFFRGPWRRSGRRIKDLCMGCGYNLTGLVEPRCPECGRPTPPGQIPSPLPATTPS